MDICRIFPLLTPLLNIHPLLGKPTRKSLLMKLGGVEEVCCLTINGDTILGDSETDVDRTTAAGKASSVQFIHFNLSADQIELFKKPNTQISVGINHPAYGHMAIISPEVKESLVKDFE